MFVNNSRLCEFLNMNMGIIREKKHGKTRIRTRLSWKLITIAQGHAKEFINEYDIK